MTHTLLLLLLALHLLAAVYWVGGMAFAYTVLRPAAGALDPPMRLPLWRRVVRALPAGRGRRHRDAADQAATACSSSTTGGFKGVALYVHVMQGLGIVMMLLYLHSCSRPGGDSAPRSTPARFRWRRSPSTRSA